MFKQLLMDKGLSIQALSKFLAGMILLGLLVFLPAGSLSYWQGWLLMGVLFVPMMIAGTVLIVKSPNLLRKRLNAREEDKEQRAIVAISGLLFITAFVVAGLNWRFGWMIMPAWTVWASAGVFLFSYLLYAEVLRENAYLSRVIEIQEGQKVVDTGLYGIVRHPMYMATTLLFLAMPLVLGSLMSFVMMLGYIPVIIKRIRNEEALLKEELEGYADYMKRVRYRLIPFIW